MLPSCGNNALAPFGGSTPQSPSRAVYVDPRGVQERDARPALSRENERQFSSRENHPIDRVPIPQQADDFEQAITRGLEKNTFDQLAHVLSVDVRALILARGH